MAMLVHHSRNSVQKQWEETLVLALSGMGRILRAHLPVLVAMPGFSQVPSSHFCHPPACVPAVTHSLLHGTACVRGGTEFVLGRCQYDAFDMQKAIIRCELQERM